MNPERDLERLLSPATSDLTPTGEHKEALRQELLSVYGVRTKGTAPQRWSRSRIVIVVAAALSTAMAALACSPSSYAVTIGQRIVFVFEAGAEPPPPADTLRSAMERMQAPGGARVWAVRDRRGATEIHIDVFDNDVDATAFADQLLREVEALRSAHRTLLPLDASARGILLDRLGRALHAQPAPTVIERARREYVSALDGAHGTGRSPQ